MELVIGGVVCVGMMLGVGLLWLVFKIITEPKRCTVCGCHLKRKRYYWRIHGRKEVLCSPCSQNAARKASREGGRRKGYW